MVDMSNVPSRALEETARNQTRLYLFLGAAINIDQTAILVVRVCRDWDARLVIEPGAALVSWNFLFVQPIHPG